MLSVDLRNMYENRLGQGLRTSDVELISDVFSGARERFRSEKPGLGYTKLPYAFDALKQEFALVDRLMDGKNTIVVVGIGGSDLGTRALSKALGGQYHNETNRQPKLYFTGDTTDPDALADLVEVLDFKTTLFLVVSKSGNTIEQASTFVYFRDLVRQQLGDGAEVKHFLFLTDATSGTLRHLAETARYQALPIPGDVGGRFSVLSSVGMVPAHLLGLNVEGFLQGAADLDQQLSEWDYASDTIMSYVALNYMYYRNNHNVAVVMPYKYALYDFAKWYQQLWAESLGKASNVDGEQVNVGITPVAALGPVDQHSQLQLYNEGPNDKLITFIVAQNSKNDLELPKNYEGIEAYAFLQGKKFGDLLKYAQQTVAFDLARNGRPNCTITLPQVDEYHMGQLFYFFEVAVTYMGYLLNINPFDQPGVEASKNALYGILGKEGYEQERADFENFNN